MPLLRFLQSEPEVVNTMPVSQILAICGDGRLKDGSECSVELREYLSSAGSHRLSDFLDECLVGFDQSGSVLQDVVNEIGRRLEFNITSGRYQGKRGEVGFDGLWKTWDAHALVVEVKTTDVYSINLDTIAAYRDRLIESDEITRRSSVLIVVGRQDTGSLEAQIRGSRHAWDVRMVSIDGLKKLLRVKEQGEDATARKIAELLVPFEYTRIDRIIDIVFATAADVQDITEQPEEDESETKRREPGKYDFTPFEAIEAEKARLIQAFGRQYGIILVKKTRSQYWSADDSRDARFVCTVSKQYEDGGYWYAYHPQWDSFLKVGTPRIVALGMLGQPHALFIPRDWLSEQLSSLGMTGSPDSGYWHMVIRIVNGEPLMSRKGANDPISLRDFIVPL